MKRRDFIAVLAGAAAAWPIAARAQALPVIGFLRNSSLEGSTHLLSALRRGLNETGYIDGQNLEHFPSALNSEGFPTAVA